MQQMQNRVTLIGNLGSDVEITTLNSGKKLGRVRLATHDYRRNKDGGFTQMTQWHNLVGWDARAEYMARLLKKGSYVIVYGRLIHRSYEDKEGHTRQISEIVVREFDTPRTKAA